MTRIPTDFLINAHRNFNYCIPRRRERYTRLSRPLPLSAKGAGYETIGDYAAAVSTAIVHYWAWPVVFIQYNARQPGADPA